MKYISVFELIKFVKNSFRSRNNSFFQQRLSRPKFWNFSEEKSGIPKNSEDIPKRKSVLIGLGSFTGGISTRDLYYPKVGLRILARFILEISCRELI